MDSSQSCSFRGENIRRSYDTIAGEYATRIYPELKDKPFDREQLDHYAERVRTLGPVCDLGCGPAHIARYLRDRGVPSFGLDLSQGNLREARRLNPDLHFVQGDMLALGLASGSLGGIAAFYSIIHLQRSDLAAALAEMRRVLRPGGPLLAAFHLGSESIHEDTLWGYSVDFDATLFTTAEVVNAMRAAGLIVEDARERDPYSPEVEYQSRRGYVLARE